MGRGFKLRDYMEIVHLISTWIRRLLCYNTKWVKLSELLELGIKIRTLRERGSDLKLAITSGNRFY